MKDYKKRYWRNRDYISRLDDEPLIQSKKVSRIVDSVHHSIELHSQDSHFKKAIDETFTKRLSSLTDLNKIIHSKQRIRQL